VPTLARHADFNKLWFGQSLSMLGSQVTALALPLTALLFLGASATQVGILNALREVASLGLLLFAGVLVDRVRRRPLLIGSDLGRAVVVGLVPVLAFAGVLNMPVLYVTVFVLGGLTALFDLAYSSYLTTVVPPALLAKGNSRLQASESVAYIAGPSVGGFLIQLLRAPFALVVDAVTFLLSAASLLAIRTKEPEVQRAPSDEATGLRGVLSTIGAGIRLTLDNRVLRALAGTAATFNFFTGLMLTVFVIYATRTQHLSAGEIGVIYGAFGVGGFAGAMSLGPLIDRLGFGRLLVAAYAVAIAGIVPLPFLTGPKLVLVVGFSLLHAVAGWGIVTSNIVEMTMRQLTVPTHSLGRVNASFRFMIGALLPVAALVAGLLGEQIGLRTTLYVTSAGIGLSLIWLLCSPVPRLGGFEDLMPEEAPNA
jgi:MFS family permease